MKNLLYSHFEVDGYNLQYLLNRLKRKKINVFSYKIKGKKARFVVSFNDSEKVFAISKEMCYNITKIKDSGFLKPLLLAYKNLGITIGVLLFCVIIFFADNLVLGVKIQGSGKIYEEQVTNVLKEKGIKRFSLFSKVSLSNLENEIKKINKFSFASVKKSGNTLLINVEKANTEVKPQLQYALLSPCDGIIESVKVYRGRPLLNSGDSVTSGQTIVSGEMQINDTWQQTYVLAQAVIVTNSTFTFTSQNNNAQEYAVTLAKEHLGDYQIVEHVVTVDFDSQRYIYTVNMQYKVHVCLL